MVNVLVIMKEHLLKWSAEQFVPCLAHLSKWLVGDGDSKCYLDIWDIYGSCPLCDKWARLLTKRNTAECEAWTKTDSFKEWQDTHGEDSECKAVHKLDCTQHIGKCFRNKFEDLAKKGAKAPDDNSMYHGENRLGPKARQKLQQYFNNNVHSNARPGVQQNMNWTRQLLKCGQLF